MLATKHASVRGVNGTVSWFGGGLCLLKNRQMYRFTNQISFHLNYKLLGTTFAVWFHHVKTKGTALVSDCSELKCKLLPVLLLGKKLFLEAATLHQRGL